MCYKYSLLDKQLPLISVTKRMLLCPRKTSQPSSVSGSTAVTMVLPKEADFVVVNYLNKHLTVQQSTESSSKCLPEPWMLVAIWPCGSGVHKGSWCMEFECHQFQNQVSICSSLRVSNCIFAQMHLGMKYSKQRIFTEVKEY